MMKKYIYTVLLFGSLFLATACDSYLDIRPVGSVIPTTAADYRALLAGAYKKTSTANRGMASLRSDEMKSISRAENYLGSIEQWNDLSPSPSTTQFDWAAYYNILFIANHVIDNQNTMANGSEQEIRQIVGEAYMLRAYVHFLLVNLFGQPYTKPDALETKSIPLKLDTDLEKILQRNTVNEVYASISEDIEIARGLITQRTWESMFTYRFNTVSIDAFQSRLSLYMGQWQSAYAAAEQVLAQQATLVNLNTDTSLLPNDFKSVENINALEFLLSVSLHKDIIAPQSFLTTFYGAGDLRTDVYFGPANASGDRPSLKGGNAQFSCSFRVGEMYLNAAEAAAQLGKLPEARTRLLQLMQNRYTEEVYLIKSGAVNAMNQADLIAEILNERARELAFEGHRWFDLRRTTRPRIEKVLNGKTYVLEANDVRYTIPIPKAAVSANPGLGN